MAMLSKIPSSLFLSLSHKPNTFLVLSRSNANATKHIKNAKAGLAKEKRRTRSDKQFNRDAIMERCNVNDTHTKSFHVPVMLGEVLDVFAASSLTSFVDCTLGAAGHSTAVIRGHPELKYFVGMDVDSVAHDIAKPRLDAVLSGDGVKAFTILRNFRDIKYVLRETGEQDLVGVDGILMDLGMSSMQVDDPMRGFSVLGDGPLDMRMDPQACDRQVLKQKTY